MVKYLNRNEKSKTRSLYEEAFFEDSDKFIDYYYDEKLKDNRILADIDNEGLHSMLMLNPYNIMIFDKLYRLDYIVAVATDKRFKRQGYMRKLLNRALTDMNKEKKPFTYLIPADKDYYLPFDFVFAAKKNEYHIDLSETEILTETFRDDSPDDMTVHEILNFLNNEISRDNDVYTQRDLEYFKREQKEIASEDGYINIYRDKGGIAAYESFWGREKKELKERIVLSALAKREYGRDNIMVRITDVGELLSNFVTSDNRKLDFILKINDKIVDAQNGFFRVRMNGKHGEACRTEAVGEEETFIEFDISDFTAWIFGHEENPIYNYTNLNLESIGKNAAERVLKSVRRIDGIFINEYV